tara:strand:+ start:1163 stop:1339 length:177 start_codon:yes stop_codon:yes gene_type:complete
MKINNKNIEKIEESKPNLKYVIINGNLINLLVAPTSCIVFIICLFEYIESLIELLIKR